jgi:hypothetical protein
MDIRDDRLEEIETGFWERGPLPGRDIEWLLAEIKRLRAVPEAIAQRCEQYAGPKSDSLAGGAFREAARIARELGHNG